MAGREGWRARSWAPFGMKINRRLRGTLRVGGPLGGGPELVDIDLVDPDQQLACRARLLG